MQEVMPHTKVTYCREMIFAEEMGVVYRRSEYQFLKSNVNSNSKKIV